MTDNITKRCRSWKLIVSSLSSLCPPSSSSMLGSGDAPVLGLLLVHLQFKTKMSSTIPEANINFKPMYESQNVDLVVVEALAKSSFDGHSGRGMCSQWSCFSWISIETCDQFCKLTGKLTLRYVVGFMSGASTPRCQPSTSVANTTGARPNAPITRRRVNRAARLGAALSSCLFCIRKTASTPQYIMTSAHGVKSTHGHQDWHKGAVRLQDNFVIKANAPKGRAQRQRQNAIISVFKAVFPQILSQTKLHKHKYPGSSRHRNHCHMPLIGSDIPYSSKSAIVAVSSKDW